MFNLAHATSTARLLQFTIAPLLALALTVNPGCDGDDGATSDAATDAGTGEASESSAGSAGGSGGSSQGRTVQNCEASIVCEDGTEVGAMEPLCMTGEEAAQYVALLGDSCDMPAACEDIGDGTTIECFIECVDTSQPCECDDESQACPA